MIDMLRQSIRGDLRNFDAVQNTVYEALAKNRGNAIERLREAFGLPYGMLTNEIVDHVIGMWENRKEYF